MLRMREEIIDIETALRRRLNWGKGVSLGGESTSSRELIEEVDSHIKSLKNKINYRDKLIAHKQEVISDREATINQNNQSKHPTNQGTKRGDRSPKVSCWVITSTYNDQP